MKKIMRDVQIYPSKKSKIFIFNGLYRGLLGQERNNNYPQFSDHYFTGDYPIKPLDNLQGLNIQQLSLLSNKSN